MRIKDLVKKEDIIYSGDIKDKEEAIYFLANHLYKNKKIKQIDDFVKEVYRREEMGPTGFGKGIAIPHAKSNVVKETNLTILKLENPINWETLDSENIKIIFLISVPEENSNKEHLKILANISRKLVDDNFISMLMKSNTSEEILNIL